MSYTVDREVRFVRKAMATLIALAGGVGGSADLAHAEKQSSRKAFPGEYVITERVRLFASSTPQDGGLSVPIRSIGGSVRLVRPKFSPQAATTGRAAKPIDGGDTFCEQMIRRGEASSCSPNFEYHASDFSGTPTDQFVRDLWGMQTIHASAGWNADPGADTVVAIIDTGLDLSHPDLVGNLWVNPGEIPGNGIDDDGNGYIDDVYGANTAEHTGNPQDDNGHGTHVAGTIGAVGNNGIGVIGVDPHVKILAVKFLDSKGSGSLSSALDALNYVVTLKQRGVPIRALNASWGGSGYSEALEAAFRRLGDAGVMVAAAAGNEGIDTDSVPEYPANFHLDNVISVGSIDSDRNLSSFSNYGKQSVSIAAPGSGILSTYLGGRYATLSGTSMATPHVTGALALAAARYPQATITELRSRILAASANAATLVGVVQTAGVLDVAALLGATNVPVIPTATPVPIATPDTSSCTAANNCSQGDEPTVESLTLNSQAPSGQRSLAVRKGGVVVIKIRGTGTGLVGAKIGFDKALCSDSIDIPMISGEGKISLRVPRNLRNYRRFMVTVGSITKTIQVYESAAERLAKLTKKKRSASMKAICTMLISRAMS